jgi:hypothetical protein
MMVKINTDYELVMPKKYVELSEDEMEYDGGISLGGLWNGFVETINRAANFVSRNQQPLAEIGLGLVSVAGGIAAFAIPEPTMVSKVLGAYAIGAGACMIVDGWNNLK